MSTKMHTPGALLVVLFLASTYAQTCDPNFSSCNHVCDVSLYSFSSQLNNEYTVHWRVTGDTIALCAQVQTSAPASLGWIGFGISTPGQKMNNADLMIGRMVDTFWTVEDLFSERAALDGIGTDISRGGVDSLLTKGGGRVGNQGALRFTRKLVTGDANDRPISATAATEILWAYSNSGSDALGYHGPERGTASLAFHQGIVPINAPAICPPLTDPGVAHTTRIARLKFDWAASNFAQFPCAAVLGALAQHLGVDAWRVQAKHAWPGSVHLEVQLGDTVTPSVVTADQVEATLSNDVVSGALGGGALGAGINAVEFRDSQGRSFIGPGGGGASPLFIGIIVAAAILVLLIIVLVILCIRYKSEKGGGSSYGGPKNNGGRYGGARFGTLHTSTPSTSTSARGYSSLPASSDAHTIGGPTGVQHVGGTGSTVHHISAAAPAPGDARRYPQAHSNQHPLRSQPLQAEPVYDDYYDHQQQQQQQRQQQQQQYAYRQAQPAQQAPRPPPQRAVQPQVHRMVAITAYQGNAADSTLSVRAGERLLVKDVDWTGEDWTWAKNLSGDAGYVATSFLKMANQ